ncbi:MAG: CPBP family intramembrane metalloprotease [Deltaproteobacteria bacterium]|nr:MAG: CPBP family intramembrane metalloprotease [Deltaproteobacteria bacterium]
MARARSTSASPARGRASTRPARFGWLGRYLATTRTPAASALAVLPLLLLYGVGLAFASEHARSGVDPVSGPLRASLSRDGYLAVQLGLAAAIAIWAFYHLRRAFPRHLALTAPVIAESSLYGVGLGGVILFVLDRAQLLSVSGDASTLFDRAVAASGSGLYEELLFRLVLLTLVAVALERAFEVPRWLALTAAVAFSSLAFALAHHLAGEPLDLFAFSYRTVAGVLFAGLFLARGFAVAAWTHAAYDFYVLSL